MKRSLNSNELYDVMFASLNDLPPNEIVKNLAQMLQHVLESGEMSQKLSDGADAYMYLVDDMVTLADQLEGSSE